MTRTFCLFAVVVLLLSGLTATAFEVEFPEDGWKKLDSFEAHTLGKADQLYKTKKYRTALKAYDAFLVEFPRSEAVVYAVIRKARSLHMDDKRFKAIEAYEEVLDYFPNIIPYAAPALYLIGQCHWQNGDIDKALIAWKEMAEDVDYRKHTLAADAINKLADNLWAQDRQKDAVEYYTRVATEFRVVNRAPAYHAVGRVLFYYIRLSPDEPKLRELYTTFRTFEGSAATPPKDVEADHLYWRRIWENVWRYGGFKDVQKKQRIKYFTYWAKAFAGRHLGWDDYQIHLANMHLSADSDRDAWFKRLDEQYVRLQKPDDWGRTLRWLGMYLNHDKKLVEYIAKLDYQKMGVAGVEKLVRLLCGPQKEPALAQGKHAFMSFYNTVEFDKLNNADIQRLVFVVYDVIRDKMMARSVLEKIRFDELTDDQKKGIARALWHRDGDMVKSVCTRFTDVIYGKIELLEYYHPARMEGQLAAPFVPECLPLATELTKDDNYAVHAWWKKADFHVKEGQYQEAIASYQMAGSFTKSPYLPNNLWAIVDCYLAMGKVPPAIAQLVEIEANFKDLAPRAKMRMAYVYRDVGDKPKYVSNLREVLKKYPETGQSSTAHQLLEDMGYKTGGAQDAD